jgi:hypothetical protein
MAMATSLAVNFRSFTTAHHMTRACWITRLDNFGVQRERTTIRTNCLDIANSTQQNSLSVHHTKYIISIILNEYPRLEKLILATLLVIL